MHNGVSSSSSLPKSDDSSLQWPSSAPVPAAAARGRHSRSSAMLTPPTGLPPRSARSCGPCEHCWCRSHCLQRCAGERMNRVPRYSRAHVVRCSSSSCATPDSHTFTTTASASERTSCIKRKDVWLQQPLLRSMHVHAAKARPGAYSSTLSLSLSDKQRTRQQLRLSCGGVFAAAAVSLRLL